MSTSTEHPSSPIRTHKSSKAQINGQPAQGKPTNLVVDDSNRYEVTMEAEDEIQKQRNETSGSRESRSGSQNRTTKPIKLKR